MIGDIIFIGNKKNPNYMIEFYKNKKKIIIYKPDKYSFKMKTFFDQYSLGEIIYEGSYLKYYYIKNNCNLFSIPNLNIDHIYLLPEIIIYIKDKEKDKYFLINDEIYES
jgi:hypothetical protein